MAMVFASGLMSKMPPNVQNAIIMVLSETSFGFDQKLFLFGLDSTTLATCPTRSSISPSFNVYFARLNMSNSLANKSKDTWKLTVPCAPNGYDSEEQRAQNSINPNLLQ